MTNVLAHLYAGIGAGIIIGIAIGWWLRYRTWKYRKIVVPPPSGSTKAPYEVRLDGRTVYSGYDLQEAKKTFKSDDHPRGVLELYGHGNHISSRKVKWL